MFTNGDRVQPPVVLCFPPAISMGAAAAGGGWLGLAGAGSWEPGEPIRGGSGYWRVTGVGVRRPERGSAAALMARPGREREGGEENEEKKKREREKRKNQEGGLGGLCFVGLLLMGCRWWKLSWQMGKGNDFSPIFKS